MVRLAQSSFCPCRATLSRLLERETGTCVIACSIAWVGAEGYHSVGRGISFGKLRDVREGAEGYQSGGLGRCFAGAVTSSALARGL